MKVIYEDNHLIAVNKTGSEIVQGDKTGDVPIIEMVKSYIKKKYNKPGEVYLGLPHRLDRPTSGVVLLARTSKALTRINKMFQNSEIQKIYWAITANKPEKDKDTLENYLFRDTKKNKSAVVRNQSKYSKFARLHYKIITKSERYYLLEIELETGRHHQIRAQLAHINCPIKGDLKYGFPRSNKDGGISLHARQISFIHPVKKEKITITADPPNDNLWNAFVKLI